MSMSGGALCRACGTTHDRAAHAFLCGQCAPPPPDMKLGGRPVEHAGACVAAYFDGGIAWTVGAASAAIVSWPDTGLDVRSRALVGGVERTSNEAEFDGALLALEVLAERRDALPGVPRIVRGD